MHKTLYCFQGSFIPEILIHPQLHEATLPVTEPTEMRTHLGAATFWVKHIFPNLWQKAAWRTVSLTLSFFSALAACLQIGCQTSEPKGPGEEQRLRPLTATSDHSPHPTSAHSFVSMCTLRTHPSGRALSVSPLC